MILIIGGAYQGKTDFAKSKFNLTDEDIFDCTDKTEIDTTKKCITHLEQYIKNNKEPFVPKEDQIIICDDIFCGVVPINPTDRAWREETGRVCARLSEEATEVYRVFCGLEQKLK